MSCSFMTLPIDSQHFLLSKSPAPADKSFGFLTQALTPHFGGQKRTIDCFSVSQNPKATQRNGFFPLNRGGDHLPECVENQPILINILKSITDVPVCCCLPFHTVKVSRTRVMSYQSLEPQPCIVPDMCVFSFFAKY